MEDKQKEEITERIKNILYKYNGVLIHRILHEISKFLI